MATCCVPNGRPPINIHRGRKALCRSPKRRRRRPKVDTGGNDEGCPQLPAVGGASKPSSPVRDSNALLRLPLPRKAAVPRQREEPQIRRTLSTSERIPRNRSAFPSVSGFGHGVRVNLPAGLRPLSSLGEQLRRMSPLASPFEPEFEGEPKPKRKVNFGRGIQRSLLAHHLPPNANQQLHESEPPLSSLSERERTGGTGARLSVSSSDHLGVLPLSNPASAMASPMRSARGSPPFGEKCNTPTSREATGNPYLPQPQVTPQRSVTGTMLARALLGGKSSPNLSGLRDATASPTMQSPKEEAEGISFDIPGVRHATVTTTNSPYTKPRLPSIKNAANAVTAARRVSHVPQQPQPPPTLPFTEEEYMTMKAQFELMDQDHTGDLTWAELQTMSAATGMYVDYKTFKQMDKDRSGTVDFEEMLRMFYPRARKGDIKWANRHWGEPGDERKAIEGQNKEKVKDWREGYDKDSLDELRNIFALFCNGSGAVGDGDHNPMAYFEAMRAVKEDTAEEARLTRGQLERMLNTSPWITPDDIDRLFEHHAKSPGQETSLSFEEFAEVMESAFPRDSSLRRQKVSYSYTEAPKGAPSF